MTTREQLLENGGRVNHPNHYQKRGVECIVAIRGMGCDLANAVKYVYRAPDKGDELRDLLSARFYLLDHMHYVEAQIPISLRSVDALRCIGQTCDPKGPEYRFFFAVSDGNLGDALAALEELITQTEQKRAESV